MAKKLSSRETMANKGCPEAFRHGPPDRNGRCPWCRSKFTTTAAMPVVHPVSDLTDSYEMMYDPDWGALTNADIIKRYVTGQQP